MSDKKNTSPKKEGGRKSIFAALFSKGKQDKTYRSDLLHQWEGMKQRERVQFILGAVVGLLLFMTALGLSGWVLSMLIN